ncbi:MAG TPA: hypothetical protein VGG19_08215 [Tepidisphaeraceae bacterium]
MHKQKSILSAALLLMAAACSASPLTAGDVVIYRVGDGTTPLVNTGSAVFVDEYTPTGTLVESIPLPTTTDAATGQNALVASGTATSEGLLTVSPNGQYIALTGYDSAIGANGNLSGTASTVVPRTVGIIPVSTGTPDTSTALTNFASGNNPRTAVTTDGTNIWVGGAVDVSYTTKGSTIAAEVPSTSAIAKNNNVEQLNIFGGQLYFSSEKSTGFIGSIGTGMPSTGSQSVSFLTGIPADSNAYSFVMFDLDPNTPGVDTLYFADASANAIDKYVLESGTWTAAGSIAATGAIGLTGSVNSSGNVDLFATTGGGSAAGGGTLYSFIDNTGIDGTVSGTATSIATAGTDEAFRGVTIIPVPEPGLAAAAGALIVLARKRSR